MGIQKSSAKHLHHVAYASRDTEATYDFYVNKMGFPLVHVENHPHNKGWFRHFFFDIGNGECIAFFEIHNIGEKPDYKTEVSVGLGMPVWVNHVAFQLDSLEELDVMKKRLLSKGIPQLMEVDHGAFISVYLTDPNGIMVEFCVTHRPEQMCQSPEEALRLLRMPKEEFTAADRKDSREVVRVITAA